jgi:hypothetical protein
MCVYVYTYQMQKQLNMPFRHRSVELYNPSVYSGMFVRKFDVPLSYTRTTTTYPTHTESYVTKQYTTKGDKYDMLTKNSNTPLWNVSNIYPLRDRRQILF